MKRNPLKAIRIVASTAFFIATALVFLDFRGWLPTPAIQAVLYLQFVPSLLAFITVVGMSAAGFLLIFVLTLFFGRVYCSTICPLGFLQDVISRIAKRSGMKKKYKLSKPKTRIRYLILGGVTVALPSGFLLPVYMLDPFSFFGRVMSVLVRPVYIGFNNLLSYVLGYMDIYVLYPETVNLAGIAVTVFTLGWLIFVIWLSFHHGRLYCNSVCPLGTLLGLVSHWSIFKIKFRQDLCTNCGDCAIVCKAQCIDIKRKTIDFSRCVACFNCVDSCPENGLKYRLIVAAEKKQVAVNQRQRRKILAIVWPVIFSGYGRRTFAGETVSQNVNATVPESREFPVCPPGAISLDRYSVTCTACQLCVSVCPTGVLQPSFLEYGLSGFMRPRMDYDYNFCNYECTLCGEICPSGAILPLTGEDKKITQIGKAEFIIENCIVYTQNTACGSCSEHCPTQAVHMVSYLEILDIPEVDQSLCIGCGACEYACPTRPFRAIYVDGNAIHLTAKLPPVERIEETTTEEFPF